jgi:hypothetical protein
MDARDFTYICLVTVNIAIFISYIHDLLIPRYARARPLRSYTR